MSRQSSVALLSLDERRDVLAVLGLGCDEKLAAAYVGRPLECLHETAKRYTSFREALEKAKTRAQVDLITNIRNASRNERFWRAAVWVLERIDPERYGPRRLHADSDSRRLHPALERIVQILLEEIPDPKRRQSVLKRLSRLVDDCFAEAE
jgi:uncharacterized protein YdiU (UPF0061 family)